jgi:cell division protein FtsQ
MSSYAAPLPSLPVDIRLMNVLANAVFALAGCALLGAGVMWVARQPVFAFRAIEIEGDVSRNNASTIRANAQPMLKGNFFTMDLAQARKAFESVPWVRHATVQRVWPGVLRVQLQEHHAAAIWQGAEGDEQLVDTDGDVFAANVGDVEDEGLPTFSGPEGSSPRMLAMYRTLQPTFEQGLDSSIESMALSGRGSWRVELDKGTSVELGRGDEAEVLARTQRFLRTLPQVTGHFQRALVSADLRHTDGYAVKLRGVTTDEQSAAGKAKTKRN